MANCTITGTVKWNTLPKAGVTVYARIEKTGEVQFTEAQRVATSDAAGLVTFDLPQSCIAYIEGEFQCGATNFNVPGGVALTIPAAASATLESLSAAVTFPSTGAVVQDDGVALANPISTFNYGTGLTAVESSPGVALLSAAGAATFLALTDTPATFVGQALKVARVNAGETALEFSAPVSVTAEEIQDALVNFFPDIAPFDWTYDDAGDRVTLNILDATSGARGLMSTAYAARLDQLEVGDAPTFAGLTLTGALLNADGTAGAPSYSFTSDGTFGMRKTTSGVGFQVGTTSPALDITRSGSELRLDSIGSGSTLALLTNGGIRLSLDSGFVKFSVGTVGRWMNLDTDASNYERGFAQWNTNVFELGTQSAGTGVGRSLRLVNRGVAVMDWDSAGNLTIPATILTSGGSIIGRASLMAFESNVSISLANTIPVNWSSTGGYSGSKNLGLIPAAGPVLKVTNGSSGSGAINILQIAGAVSDASFAAPPPDGTIALDSTNFRIYIRFGGAWKMITLA